MNRFTQEGLREMLVCGLVVMAEFLRCASFSLTTVVEMA